MVSWHILTQNSSLRLRKRWPFFHIFLFYSKLFFFEWSCHHFIEVWWSVNVLKMLEIFWNLLKHIETLWNIDRIWWNMIEIYWNHITIPRAPAPDRGSLTRNLPKSVPPKSSKPRLLTHAAGRVGAQIWQLASSQHLRQHVAHNASSQPWEIGHGHPAVAEEIGAWLGQF